MQRLGFSRPDFGDASSNNWSVVFAWEGAGEPLIPEATLCDRLERFRFRRKHIQHLQCSLRILRA